MEEEAFVVLPRTGVPETWCPADIIHLKWVSWQQPYGEDTFILIGKIVHPGELPLPELKKLLATVDGLKAWVQEHEGIEL